MTIKKILYLEDNIDDIYIFQRIINKSTNNLINNPQLQCIPSLQDLKNINLNDFYIIISDLKIPCFSNDTQLLKNFWAINKPKDSILIGFSGNPPNLSSDPPFDYIVDKILGPEFVLRIVNMQP